METNQKNSITGQGMLLVCLLSIVHFTVSYSSLTFFPYWQDAFQVLGSHTPKFKFEGRWFTEIIFPIIKQTPARPAFFLDILSYLFLGYVIFKATSISFKDEPVLLTVVLILWVMAPPLQGIAYWPGVFAFPNALTAACLLALYRYRGKWMQIITFCVAGIVLVGSYQSHYFLLLLGVLPIVLNSEGDFAQGVKAKLLVILYWMLGFVVGYIVMQAVYFANWNSFFHSPSTGYRVLNDSGGSVIAMLPSNLFELFAASLKNMLPANSSDVLYVPLILLSLAGLLVSAYSVARKYGIDLLVFIFGPAAAFFAALAITNHIYIDRISTSVWASILVLVVLAVKGSRATRLPLIILMSVFTFFCTLQSIAKITNTQEQITFTQDVLTSSLDDAFPTGTRTVIIYGDVKAPALSEFKSPRFYTYLSDKLNISRLMRCRELSGHICKDYAASLPAFKKGNCSGGLDIVYDDTNAIILAEGDC